MDSFSDLSEDGLGDEVTTESKLGGKLHFFDDLDVSETTAEENNLSAISSEHFCGLMETPRPGNMKFDVVDARIEVGRSKKHVVYTILIIRSGGLDRMPVKIEKRFTEFYLLNSDLKKHFPQLMKEISFPSKCLRRNFEAETIACRSRSFEQYLSHLFSIETIKTSAQFKEFLFGQCLREGYGMIESGRYSDATVPLLMAWKLQAKLIGDFHTQTISTLCAVVCCHEMLQQYQVAHTYADLALRSIADDDDVHLVPLLKVDIRLCWNLGIDKREIEARLLALQKKRGVDIDGTPSLLEHVINHFKA